MENRNFEPQHLGNISPEKAIEVGNSLLQQAGQFTASAKRKFLTPTSQDAGSKK